VRSVPAQSAAAAVIALLGLVSSARGINLPAGFVAEDAAPGAHYYAPTAIAFTPDGRLLVADKIGTAWVVQNGARLPQMLWDGHLEVQPSGNGGITGIAVDPDYVHNHFVYFAYTMDPDSNGIYDLNPTFGRVVRFRTAAWDSNVVDPASKTVLIGRAWPDGVPAGKLDHVIDGLRFGADGSLLVTAGDGAGADSADGGGSDPLLFAPGRTDPAEDIGAFRSQYIRSLAGKILRINPATGEGYPSNPYFDGNPGSNQSKVWAYGLRNPWRISVRPGTGSTDPGAGRPGTLYIGDVGWGWWEEIDIARTGGLNFGWPCYEGIPPLDAYQVLHPARAGCGTWGSSDNPAAPTPPTLDYHHYDADAGMPPGYIGNAIMGGLFYTGALYPAEYRDRLFFGDYGAGWIRVANFDTSGVLVELQEFATDAGGPVDFAADPRTGDLFYIAINEARVYHVRYTGASGGNQPPQAHASGGPLVGVVPFTVTFSAAGTTDPDLDPLELGWNFGDGLGAGGPAPTHTYTAPGNYAAVLTADDLRGGVARDTLLVVALEANTFPSTPVLDDFGRGNGAIGAPWAGDTTGFRIDSGTLELVSSYASAVRADTTFGPDQEAVFSFAGDPDPSTAAAILLKVQGTRTTDGSLLALYDATLRQVAVETYSAAAGWQQWGDPIPVTFAAGDQMGARAFRNGVVEVRKNGIAVGSVSCDGWAFAGDTGHLGLALLGSEPVRVDDFGGGGVVIDGNHPPQSQLLSPANLSFFVAGDTIRLAGSATDDRDPPSSLHFAWDVSLQHNNHIHPGIFTATGPTAEFVAENHDDGTGVHYIIRLSVSDAGGLEDVGRSEVFPEVDLEAGSFAIASDPWIGTASPTPVRFAIQNHGRMPAPRSHWALTVDGTTIAEGDTLVPTLGSVTIAADIPAGLDPGEHTLRATADTLGLVRETNEANNGSVRTIVVTPGGLAVDGSVAFRPPGPARPNPARAGVSFALALGHAAPVRFAVWDVSGRRIWSAPAGVRPAGELELRWSGVLASGARAPAGLYFARIEIEGRSWSRRFAIIR
jgi:glucose/arabinose dehydrogenase